jgi:hypothetical protein
VLDMSNNIALLTPDQRADIELDKHAALLVWQLKHAKISRYDVKAAIDSADESKREMLRGAINKYMGMR